MEAVSMQPYSEVCLVETNFYVNSYFQVFLQIEESKFINILRMVDVFWCAAEYRYRGSGGSRDSNVPTD